MNVYDRLIKKSQEAFLLAIENFNKPTILYRLESFVYLMCNSWELMLKAYLIKAFGNDSIYYQKKDGEKYTLTLSECVNKVFTNKKDPLRLNLEKIMELRNISTHFITEEYDMIYIPVFQSSIFNYNEKMAKFHNVDISKIVNPNFLTLTPSMKAFNRAEIIAKYPEEIAMKLIDTEKEITKLTNENNYHFAIKIEHLHFITKNEDEATSKIKIDNSSDSKAKIIKEQVNPNNTHKYSAKGCILEINKLLNKNNIILKINGNPINKFNMYHFKLLVDYYGIKSIEKLCFVYNIHSQPSYSYSYHTIEFLFEQLKKDPNNILQSIKDHLRKS